MKLRWILRYQRVILAAFNKSFSIWSKILDTMLSSPYQWNGKTIEKGSYTVKVTQEEGKILQCVLILQGFQWIETGIPFDYTHSCISGPKSGDYTISWRSSDTWKSSGCSSYSEFMFWKSNEDIMYWESCDSDRCIEFSELDSGIILPELYKGWETGLKYGI